MSHQEILQIFATLETSKEIGVKIKAFERLKSLPSATARGKGRFFVELYYEALNDIDVGIKSKIGQELLDSILPIRYSLVISRLILIFLENSSTPTVSLVPLILLTRNGILAKN